MSDPGKEREGGRLTTPPPAPQQASQKQDSSKTAGTDRDFDESGESINQGHGHPREERDSGDRK